MREQRCTPLGRGDTVATAKRDMLLPKLNVRVFLGELLPKRRGMRGLLELSSAVDLHIIK